MTAAPPRQRQHRPLSSAVLVALLLSACDPNVESPAAGASEPKENGAALALLANARWEAAREKHAAGAPAEALALLTSALAGDPMSTEVRELAREILAETHWHVPELTLAHDFPVDRLEISTAGQLWVALSGGFSTAVRWDLEALSVGAVLFPTAAPAMRILVADPGHRYLVVQRSDVTLLCDALTLKPIREIGPLPDALTPSAVVAFSADGLLLAHPSGNGREQPTTWQIRDSATGEILRSWLEEGENPRALAAHLDRQRLRLLKSDGSFLEIPVSPVEEVETTAAASPTDLIHAQFLADGRAAWAAENRGPHEDAALHLLSFGLEIGAGEAALEIRHHHPWSRHPGVWNGLFRGTPDPPIGVSEHTLRLAGIRHAPIHSPSPLAAALAGEHLVTGDSGGTVIFHRLLPLPAPVENPPDAGDADASHADEFAKLALALTGTRRDERTAGFAERRAALDACDFRKIAELFPDLDFTPVVEAFRTVEPRAAAADALNPLRERLIRAGFLKEPAPSPRAFTRTVEEIFASKEEAAIEAAIRSSGGKGKEAATALALALDSSRPDWVRAAIDSAEDLPPLLSRIALSRAAWLEGRKGEALAGWHETFPDLNEVRRREDWDGWEQADFTPALRALEESVRGELAALAIPRAPDKRQRQEILRHLTARETLEVVGRDRLAAAALDAALVFSSFPDESENAFHLASLARQLGAPAARCLRAEALSLTAMGDFGGAQPRWITLITEHPVETHEPGDYAEAAYTAFENDDLRQALEILATGMHRFPQDGAFAIRAGWVALLIGHAERAYEFLLTGERIGFPEDRLETAITLLAIAAAQSGYSDDALMYYEDLIDLDEAWENPETLETLEWPEPLKATLRQLTWGPLLLPE